MLSERSAGANEGQGGGDVFSGFCEKMLAGGRTRYRILSRQSKELELAIMKIAVQNNKFV